jgi:hypothetical protein
MLRAIQKTLVFFLITHFFIALIAVLLALETNVLLHQPFQHWSLYAFIFTSTHFAYNVYYIKTEKRQMFMMLASVSLIASTVLLFFIPQVFYPRLFFIGAASGLYILPVFLPFKKNKYYTFLRLLLLIFVWVSTTWVLPAEPKVNQYSFTLLLIWRVVLIGVSCLLFFIRDEKDSSIKQRAVFTVYILLALQSLLAVAVLIYIQALLGCVLLLICALCIFCSVRFLKHQHNHVFYLAFADGILFAEAGIILFLHLLHAL